MAVDSLIVSIDINQYFHIERQDGFSHIVLRLIYGEITAGRKELQPTQANKSLDGGMKQSVLSRQVGY